MKTIYKYALDFESVIEMPYGSPIIDFKTQGPTIEPKFFMWVLVDTTGPVCARKFCILATGQEIPAGHYYCGTVHANGFVWHLFERY